MDLQCIWCMLATVSIFPISTFLYLHQILLFWSSIQLSIFWILFRVTGLLEPTLPLLGKVTIAGQVASLLQGFLSSYFTLNSLYNLKIFCERIIIFNSVVLTVKYRVSVCVLIIIEMTFCLQNLLGHLNSYKTSRFEFFLKLRSLISMIL